jgi:hypothetical protein
LRMKGSRMLALSNTCSNNKNHTLLRLM